MPIAHSSRPATRSAVFLDETRLITPLKRVSPAFSAFYERERGKIRYPIAWEHVPGAVDWDGSISRVGGWGQTESALIQLREIAPTEHVAFVAAHELVHALHDVQRVGVDLRVVHPVFDRIGIELSTLLCDPLVTKTLQQHGFDGKSVYQADYAHWVEYLINSPHTNHDAQIDALRFETFALCAVETGMPRSQIHALRALVGLVAPEMSAQLERVERAYQRTLDHRAAWALKPLAQELIKQLNIGLMVRVA